jgi:predicted aspartyl protease
VAESPYLGPPVFDPPAPSCEVTIRHGNESRVLPALVDSGASLTCIPKHLVGDLRLIRVGDIAISGATGHDESEGLYAVTLEFLGIQFPNHPVASLGKRSYLIIGRDILNKYNSIHSGPTLTFTLQTT